MGQREVPETATAQAASDELQVLVTERLEAEITTLAAHLTAAECRFLLLVAEFDRREAFLAWGCRTAAFWLSWKCGLDIRSAQEKLRVARALAACPHVVEAFAAGRLSYSKVRAITRIVTPENEEELVSLALHATAAQVERAVRAYRGVLSREAENARAVQRRADRRHDVEWDDELGMLAGRYRLTPEDGEVWVKGLDAAAEHLRKANPDLGYGVSFADALVVLAESYLAHGPAARAGGDRYLAMINLDADVLAFDACEECAIHRGPALGAETARWLTCDCSAALVIRDSNGEVLDVGRKTRTLPRAIRRALRTRDVTCRWPGCDEARYVQGHHVRHWAHGGPTALSNLVSLCWYHHFLVHEGGWQLEVRDDGSLRITDPHGHVLGEPPTPEVDPDAPDLVAQNTARGVAIAATTAIPKWYGESIDLDRVVTWLLWSADHSYANFGTLPADQPANLYQRQPLIGSRL